MSYSDQQIEQYKKDLRKIASISNLFSQSDAPLLSSRTTEYLYCKDFGAENISRSDVTIDAQLGTIGIGIKTFGYTGNSSQEKIAEFNSALKTYKGFSELEMVKKVGELRNERIELVERMFGVESTVYHCIARSAGRIFVFEEPMHKIDVDNITLLEKARSDNVINFTDGREKYAFNTSKSTLYKHFIANEENILFDIEVTLMDDPLSALERLQAESEILKIDEPVERLVLPLYGHRNGEPFVFDKSGMNRWNANGEKRKRRYGEAEIMIYKEVRSKALEILPERKTSFIAHLPNGDTISLAVSQQDSKAIMSNPETHLGTWLLGKIGMQRNEVLTYQKLQELGFDSVELTFDGKEWHMDLCEPGTYEEYLDELNSVAKTAATS
ncbi:MAG: hypothetical protein WA030_00010 [Candidatus Microsaccharimonas sp.]